MTILIVVLPAVAAILALVFVFSRRGGRITENKKRIDMKMIELQEELEKAKERGTKGQRDRGAQEHKCTRA